MAATRQLVRSFSTSRVSQALVQCPVQVFGVEGRYATALYSAAVKSKKLDAVEKDLNKIKNRLSTDKNLQEFVVNPTLKRTDKVSTFLNVLAKDQCSDLTKNMFGIMGDNGRLNKINGVLTAFGRIMSAHRGEVVCTVTTAKPLDKGQEKELNAALQAFLKPGEVLQLTMATDPSIIGGMVVSIGDKYIDMSLSKKIKMYKNLLQQSV